MGKTKYHEIFKRQIKFYMERAGKTQADLVRDLGYTQSRVSSWCTGMRVPRVNEVDKIAEYLGCSRSELMGWEEKEYNITAIDEKQLIDAYRSLTSESRKETTDYIKYLLHKQNK